MPDSYYDLMAHKGGEAIERQAQRETYAANAGYYSKYAGTGFSDPYLRLVLRDIGKREHQASANLGAYTEMMKAREASDERMRQMQESQEDYYNDLEGQQSWWDTGFDIAGKAAQVLPFLI